MAGSSMKQIPATALTANDSTSKEELGRLRIESDGKEYRYVRVSTTSQTANKGDLVYFCTSANYLVNVTAAAARRNAFAGVTVGTITKAYYGWVQCRGYNTYLHTDGGVSAGGLFVVDSTNSRTARRISNTGQLLAIGHAVKADSGSVLTSCFLTRG